MMVQYEAMSSMQGRVKKPTFVVGVRSGADDLNLDLGLEEVDGTLNKSRHKSCDSSSLQYHRIMTDSSAKSQRGHRPEMGDPRRQ